MRFMSAPFAGTSAERALTLSRDGLEMLDV
jgi:hypothetical protein